MKSITGDITDNYNHSMDKVMFKWYLTLPSLKGFLDVGEK